jgi:hypothetical protein
MAKTIIKIEVEDIKTSFLGENIELKIDDKLSIVFSRQALDELVIDYTNLKAE